MEKEYGIKHKVANTKNRKVVTPTENDTDFILLKHCCMLVCSWPARKIVLKLWIFDKR